MDLFNILEFFILPFLHQEVNNISFFILCIKNISMNLINDQIFRAQVWDCEEAAS